MRNGSKWVINQLTFLIEAFKEMYENIYDETSDREYLDLLIDLQKIMRKIYVFTSYSGMWKAILKGIKTASKSSKTAYNTSQYRINVKLIRILLIIFIHGLVIYATVL
jgi:hypothetical protein